MWIFQCSRRDDAGNLTALHHPFTAPALDDEQALKADPDGALSRAYDMVLNGTELGGGSVRIHRPEIQRAVFELLNISDEEAEEKFGFLLTALKFGTPPHGGIGLRAGSVGNAHGGSGQYSGRYRLFRKPRPPLAS